MASAKSKRHELSPVFLDLVAVPQGGLILTIEIDCQLDRVEWIALAHGPRAETDLAGDLQLHFAIALPGLPVERTADGKRSRRPTRNSLDAHLYRISKVASGRLF